VTSSGPEGGGVQVRGSGGLGGSSRSPALAVAALAGVALSAGVLLAAPLCVACGGRPAGSTATAGVPLNASTTGCPWSRGEDGRPLEGCRIPPWTVVARRFAFGPTPELAADLRRDLAGWLATQLRPPARGKSWSWAATRRYGGEEPADPGMDDEHGEMVALRGALRSAELTARIETPWQVREALAAFWRDHFHVSFQKARAAYGPYLDDVLRRHALGPFDELLIATAEHPAMLRYLDNAANDANRGLNENYARELLELHTVGVEAGYGEGDVREVARIFSGWGLDDLRGPGRFRHRFRPADHDRDPKSALGWNSRYSTGKEEGLSFLRYLAQHPATRRRVSQRLAARFVADDPPEECVDRLVTRWEATDGEVGALVEVLLGCVATHPEAPALVKTPAEVFVSAVRVTGAVWRGDVDGEVARRLDRMGHPLATYPVPTGLPSRADALGGTGAWMARFQLLLDLAAGRLAGVRPRYPDLGWTGSLAPEELVRRIESALLLHPVSERTHTVLLRAAARGTPDPVPEVVGLALAAPEFQRQ